MFAVLIAVLSVPLILLVSGLLTRPLLLLSRESDRIRRFEVDGTLDVETRIREVAQLAASTGLMKSALSAFGKYVPRALVQDILDSSIEPKPGGERRPVTLMFTDVQGFTTLSEQVEPEALMEQMSVYLEHLVGEIQRFRGTVDKYVGDAIMAYWNAPKDEADHVALGCRAVLACRARSNALNTDWERNGEPPLYTRFGLHSGECIVGNVGSKDRLDFTVIGATVNLAARLEGLNKSYGTQVLVSQAVRQQAGDSFVFRPVDLVLPKGAVTPVLIHELVGIREDHADSSLVPGASVGAADLARCAEWERIFAACAEGDWSRAMVEIGAYARTYPDDKLATVYLKRAWLSAFSPEDEPWDGIERALTK